MIHLIDLTYYMNMEFDQPFQILESHKESLGYLAYVEDGISATIVKHLNNESTELINNIKYSFFKSKNGFFHIPYKTHYYIKRQQPDVIFIQGLVFPFQVLFLRFTIAKNCKIILQHHGEQPFKGIRKIFQKLADKCIDAYLFTAVENSGPWVEAKVITDRNKCHEVLEASTFFKKMDKQLCRAKLGIRSDTVFLWVGRLAVTKDPLTVLRGFELYLCANAGAKLYMVYQENDLLAEVNALLEKSDVLKASVCLVGKIDHDDLQTWFSAADYYISASHREAAGYALIEAMACGCIPVVTGIHSFKKIVGKYGFFFEVGNADSLYVALTQAAKIEKEKLSGEVSDHFNNKLSFKTIAEDILGVCKKLLDI